MISNFLVKKFIKNSEDIKSEKVRSTYGVLGGVVGIIINLILFAIKLTVGVVASSIAIMADAFNNLSDAASSIVTIIGFKMADKPADAEHPFGHGRMEYISALIVAFMVMLVGIQFIKSSFERILNPVSITFEFIPFILLLVSILFKLWLSRFNKFIGNTINSSALKAASVDALGDVFTSSCVTISFLASKFTSFPIDGYFGLIVAVFIVYSGYTLIKETINPILGEAPDPELVNSIKEMVLSYEHITGVHDLIVHNYGPGRCMASIHAEVPNDQEIEKSHEIIDRVERDAAKELGMMLVIHMDPVEMKDEKVIRIRKKTEHLLKELDPACSIHDFRVVWGAERINLIFDMVIPIEYDEKRRNDLPLQLMERLKGVDSRYESVITVDYDYVAKTEDK